MVSFFIKTTCQHTQCSEWSSLCSETHHSIWPPSIFSIMWLFPPKINFCTQKNLIHVCFRGENCWKCIIFEVYHHTSAVSVVLCSRCISLYPLFHFLSEVRFFTAHLNSSLYICNVFSFSKMSFNSLLHFVQRRVSVTIVIAWILKYQIPLNLHRKLYGLSFTFLLTL